MDAKTSDWEKTPLRERIQKTEEGKGKGGEGGVVTRST